MIAARHAEIAKNELREAGDLSPERMERFGRVFGKPNYELRFQLPVNGRTSKRSRRWRRDLFQSYELLF